jgi:hypothetical protein
MSSIITSIKEFFLNQKIAKANKNKLVNRYSVPFETAKTFGVYFNAGEEKYSKQINEFIKGLKKDGKRVEALTFLNESQDNPYDFPYHVLKDEDIGIFGNINSGKVTNFMDTPFDYLFCICSELQTPIKYVLSASKARCRVGLYTVDSEDLFDFMVSNNKREDLNELIKDMLHYTKHIKAEMA